MQRTTIFNNGSTSDRPKSSRAPVRPQSGLPYDNDSMHQLQQKLRDEEDGTDDWKHMTASTTDDKINSARPVSRGGRLNRDSGTSISAATASCVRPTSSSMLQHRFSPNSSLTSTGSVATPMPTASIPLHTLRATSRGGNGLIQRTTSDESLGDSSSSRSNHSSHHSHSHSRDTAEDDNDSSTSPFRSHSSSATSLNGTTNSVPSGMTVTKASLRGAGESVIGGSNSNSSSFLPPATSSSTSSTNASPRKQPKQHSDMNGAVNSSYYIPPPPKTAQPAMRDSRGLHTSLGISSLLLSSQSAASSSPAASARYALHPIAPTLALSAQQQQQQRPATTATLRPNTSSFPCRKPIRGTHQLLASKQAKAQVSSSSSSHNIWTRDSVDSDSSSVRSALFKRNTELARAGPLGSSATVAASDPSPAIRRPSSSHSTQRPITPRTNIVGTSALQQPSKLPLSSATLSNGRTTDETEVFGMAYADFRHGRGAGGVSEVSSLTARSYHQQQQQLTRKPNDITDDSSSPSHARAQSAGMMRPPSRQRPPNQALHLHANGSEAEPQQTLSQQQNNPGPITARTLAAAGVSARQEGWNTPSTSTSVIDLFPAAPLDLVRRASANSRERVGSAKKERIMTPNLDASPKNLDSGTNQTISNQPQHQHSNHQHHKQHSNDSLSDLRNSDDDAEEEHSDASIYTDLSSDEEEISVDADDDQQTADDPNTRRPQHPANTNKSTQQQDNGAPDGEDIESEPVVANRAHFVSLHNMLQLQSDSRPRSNSSRTKPHKSKK